MLETIGCDTLTVVVVNGVELLESRSLRVLRAGLTHYGLNTSGSKVKCFARLLNHQKALKLQVVHAAAEHAQEELTRTPNAVKLENAAFICRAATTFPTPSLCPGCSSCSCVCFGARSDKHEHSGGSRRSSTPYISFDFCIHQVCTSGRRFQGNLHNHQPGDD